MRSAVGTRLLWCVGVGVGVVVEGKRMLEGA
jgi:hypothetical protein